MRRPLPECSRAASLMAKLGQFALDDGGWEGRQVVSEEWIRESTRPHFHPRPDDDYGYLWWGFDEPRPGGVDMAQGVGSRLITVSRDLRMVFVTTGGNEFNNDHSAVLDVARNHLVPALG